jgi:ABC-type Fe3+/spermidine/putrescine transport system ATPase subunit
MTLELEGLTHRYGSEPVIDDVSFALEEGELVALLGPSGCGKTTLIQSIAGHVRPAAGRIRLRGEDVTDEAPESRQVGVVFQESTLFPHMTVGENVAYGLEARGVDPDRRDDRVAEYLELVSLRERRGSRPAELSGGQRRRVELARALAPQPDVLLLDEPLSALNRSLRERLRTEIARVQAETGVTTLFVTHDQDEAMALADRLVVMTDGRVAGVGEPRALYQSPPTPLVASFLGRSNALPASVLDRESGTIALGERTLRLRETPVPDAESIACHVRPADLSFEAAPSSSSTVSLPGTVERVADLGRRYDVTVRLECGEELVVEQRTRPPGIGDRCEVALAERDLTVFAADAERVRRGVPVGGRPGE